MAINGNQPAQEQPEQNVGGYTVDKLLADTPLDLVWRGHIDPDLWFTPPERDATKDHLITFLASVLAIYTQQSIHHSTSTRSSTMTTSIGSEG